MASCDLCQFFGGVPDGTTFGKCRRYPPQFAGGMFFFPDVPRYEHCGEFKKMRVRERKLVPDETGLLVDHGPVEGDQT